METKRTELEEEYLDKIVRIWRRERLTIPEKIGRSLKVVNSIDKIKWPKRASSNLSELIKISLESTLLRAIEESIEREFQGLPDC